MSESRHTFLEFFAGGGMARLGLGADWRCLFANDIDPMKCAAYRDNFGADDLVEGSIADLCVDDLPRARADLAWASFPCQDLSLAGARGGMAAARSGLFFEFWRLMTALREKRRAPRLIVLENVPGLVTSHGGDDFRTIARLIRDGGYRVAASILDAAAFTPQSRPRLFIVGVSRGAAWTPGPTCPVLGAPSLPVPPGRRNASLDDIIDWAAPAWDAPGKTEALLAMMSPLQRARLEGLLASGARRAGAGFRRTRRENGRAVQRFEARFDGLAGCLRTPAGGSSRQIILAVEDGTVRTRLMSPREAADLMGAPARYRLPDRPNAALKLCGDGVAVPVVRFLAETVLAPALRGETARAA